MERILKHAIVVSIGFALGISSKDYSISPEPVNISKKHAESLKKAQTVLWNEFSPGNWWCSYFEEKNDKLYFFFIEGKTIEKTTYYFWKTSAVGNSFSDLPIKIAVYQDSVFVK